MNTYVVLSILLVMTCIASCMNVTYLIDIYTSVCGAMLCIPKSSSSLPVDIFTNEKFCPTCSCDDSCIWTRNCCPDKFFEWKWSCVDNTIIRYSNHLMAGRSFSIVTQCPENTDQKTKRSCENIADDFEGKLTNVPVYSLTSGVSYRNIYCARCYHEKEDTILSWRIDTNCLEFADFNFLSSYEAIAEQALKKKCIFSYSIPKHDKCWNNICREKAICDKNENLITECNITGTWETYEPDIDLACRTYDNKFNRMFKNIFCYVCNPPRSTGRVMDRCNETGLWETYDVKIEQECNLTQKTTLTFPFKNFYCYLCNIKRSEINNAIELKAQELNALFSYHLKEVSKFSQFKTNIYITHFNFNEIIQKGKQVLNEVKKNGTFSVHINHQDVMLPDIMAKYYAFTGKAQFSSNYSFVDEFGYSSCERSDTCYFLGICCIEKYFKRSTGCTDPIYSDLGVSYLVFNNCPNSDSALLSDLCFLNSADDFFNFMPVEIVLDDSYATYLHYKNLYCALCDWENSLNKSQSMTKFWNLKIACSVFIPHYYFVSMDTYFKYLIENKCKVIYSPTEHYSAECVPGNTRCNETGYWTAYDKNIDIACENILFPSNRINPFCEMCNPAEVIEMKYRTCNESGGWSSYNDVINDNCLQLPLIEALAPYKNFFCRTCNEKTDRTLIITQTFPPITIDTGRNPKPSYSPPIMPGYRAIFAFSNYKPREAGVLLRCNSSQTLFQNKCLDIVCYPGKLLVDTGCQPLLQFTSNLGYIMFASIKIKINSQINSTFRFHDVIDTKFKDHVIRDMNLKSWESPFDSTYLISDQNCNQNIKDGEEVSISVYYELFFDMDVNRSFVEEALVQSISSIFKITFEDVTHAVEVTPDPIALNTPNILAKSEFTHKCHKKVQKSNDDYRVKKDQYTYSHVSDLLLCEQVEMSFKLFEIDKSSLILKFLGTGIELSPEKYIFVAPENVRFCLKYLKFNALPMPSNTFGFWSILTHICIILSLLCLFISFVTYCFFISLRTLPGKNNMCLIFAMFCSNLMFLSITQGIESDIGCKAVGILMHYFWLTTFLCLGVCSFHMYRVFSSKTVTRFSERSNLICYIAFSFGTPAVVVILNIIITLTVTGTIIGYGGNTCFLTEPMAFIFSLIVPMGLICCSNIYFFIYTSLTIARRPKLKNDSKMKANQVHFVIYVKLFAITGITWLFQIVDAFVPQSAFSTIVALLNALQGFFIFLSYICNQRVLSLYRNTHKTFRSTFSGSGLKSSHKTLTTNVPGSESPKPMIDTKI